MFSFIGLVFLCYRLDDRNVLHQVEGLLRLVGDTSASELDFDWIFDTHRDRVRHPEIERGLLNYAWLLSYFNGFSLL